MTLSRSLIIALLCLMPSYALADEAPDPPPDFGTCRESAQKQSPTDECQECNNLYQDGCEKKFKGTDFVRKCQIKPRYASEWREVWCKAPAKTEEPASKASEPTPIATAPAKTTEVKAPEPPKETPRVATEATKEAGCAVAPNGDASWILLALLILIQRRKNKQESS